MSRSSWTSGPPTPLLLHDPLEIIDTRNLCAYVAHWSSQDSEIDWWVSVDQADRPEGSTGVALLRVGNMECTSLDARGRCASRLRTFLAAWLLTNTVSFAPQAAIPSKDRWQSTKDTAPPSPIGSSGLRRKRRARSVAGVGKGRHGRQARCIPHDMFFRVYADPKTWLLVQEDAGVCRENTARVSRVRARGASSAARGASSAGT